MQSIIKLDKRVLSFILGLLFLTFICQHVFALSAPMHINGDVNSDGKVNILDVNLIRRYITGKINLSNPKLQYADIDGNGKVDVDDVHGLRCKIAHTIYKKPPDDGNIETPEL